MSSKFYSFGASNISRGFSPKERLNVWQWAEKNIILSPRSTPWPGPYRTDFCPYVRRPQELHTDNDTSMVVLCWSTRSHKTETLINPVRYSIACEPQPFMIVMSSEKQGRSFSRGRFQPSIDDCPILASEKTGNPDHYTALEMHFKRCTGWITGANSPANLSSKGVANLVCDEVDKYRQQQVRETGALQLALERIKERWNGKAYISSTPTVEGAQIWKEFCDTDMEYYMVPCLNCGEYQRLVIDQLKWDSDCKISEFKYDLVKVRKSVRYECVKCGFGHRDYNKSAMLRAGMWTSTATGNDPEKKGFHLNSLYPTSIKFAKVATNFLQSLGSPEDLQNFHNSWLALPIGSEEDRAKFEREVQSKANQYSDKVPTGYVSMLTIDVQRDRLYYVVRAWDKEKNSIRLDYGTVPDFPEAEIVARKWNCCIAVVDSAYAARQREVLEWCARHGGWVPLLGSPGLIGPIRWVEVPIDGGILKNHKVRTLRIRSGDWKEILHERINGKTPKWEIAGEPGEDYKKHLSAETRHTRRGPRGAIIVEYIPHGRHDWKDCEVYQIALYEAVRGYIFDHSPMEGPPSASPMPVKIPQDEFIEHMEIDSVRQNSSNSFQTEERDKIW